MTAEKKAVLVPDKCASCRRKLLVPIRAWEWMMSDAGKVICANVCMRDACQEKRDRMPEAIVAEINRRQRKLIEASYEVASA